ncbi:MAG TPA: molecular chaperone DnaJ, partial [Lamprocystis sp. (in: g-proteobacteria)]|nr:molecular chaperone DnaJ [Lamprocystis sp. (in: g-proteobacteria)]
MILRLLILLILLAGGIWFLYWFRRTPPARVAAVLRRVAVWTLLGVLVLAVLTGRMSPILAALAALIPVAMRLLHLLQMLPALQRLLRSLGLGLPGWAGGSGGGAAAGGQAQASAIRTRFLAMRLDHASGAMDGEVLEGPFAGQRLTNLGLDELL